MREEWLEDGKVPEAQENRQPGHAQGAQIAYLTSRRKAAEIEAVRRVLKRNRFPDGELFYRKEGEQYKDVAERLYQK